MTKRRLIVIDFLLIFFLLSLGGCEDATDSNENTSLNTSELKRSITHGISEEVVIRAKKDSEDRVLTQDNEQKNIDAYQEEYGSFDKSYKYEYKGGDTSPITEESEASEGGVAAEDAEKAATEE